MCRQITKSTLAAAVLAAGLILGATGSAYAGGFIAIEGTSVDYRGAVGEDINPRGLRLRLGVPVAPNIDIEAHIGGSKDSDVAGYDSIGTAYAGAFLKGYIPLGYTSALFMSAGLSAVELQQNIGGQRFDDHDAGFSWGLGLETEITRNADLTADYTRYLSGDGMFEEVSAVSFGLKVYF